MVFILVVGGGEKEHTHTAHHTTHHPAQPTQPASQPSQPSKTSNEAWSIFFWKTEHISADYPGGVRILQIWLVNNLERIEVILLVKK